MCVCINCHTSAGGDGGVGEEKKGGFPPLPILLAVSPLATTRSAPTYSCGFTVLRLGSMLRVKSCKESRVSRENVEWNKASRSRVGSGVDGGERGEHHAAVHAL